MLRGVPISQNHQTAIRCAPVLLDARGASAGHGTKGHFAANGLRNHSLFSFTPIGNYQGSLLSLYAGVDRWSVPMTQTSPRLTYK